MEGQELAPSLLDRAHACGRKLFPTQKGAAHMS